MPRIQHRRGTAAEWTSSNPVLAAGEIGVELDTGFLKVGDGVGRWSTRPYQRGPQGEPGPASTVPGPPGDPSTVPGPPGPPGDVTLAQLRARPAMFSGDGPPPTSIPGAVAGDWWLDKSSPALTLYEITGV